VGTNRFQIVRLLGEGGMGVVYEALDREQNALVALKTLRAVDPEALLRFKQEFRTVQDLAHPNLIRLGELIEEAGHWFFTMELVDGADLLRYVKLDGHESASAHDHGAAGTPPLELMTVASSLAPRTAPASASRPGPSPTPRHTDLDAPTETTASLRPMRPPEEDAARPRPRQFAETRLRDAFAQLADGLDRLHRSRLVHRDVKPSNVLVLASGRVVILDFGIASEVANVDDPSLLGMGTLAFMSPEQLAGAAPEPPSDCYAIGVTLYLALTGVLPHRAPTREQLQAKKLHATPRPPHELCPDVPADIEELCLALLRPDPAERPSCAEVARLLREPPAARAASATPRPRHRRKTIVPTFFGRAAELQALEAALADSQTGRTVFALVTGDSGIGKSALMRRFREATVSTHLDALVLPGRCYERESVPFKAVDGVIDALSHHLRRLDASAVAPLLPDAIDALCHVFPVLRQVDAIAQRDRAAPLGDRGDARRRVFGALRELLLRLGEREPLLVFIDDLQWADADSLALLEEVLRPPGPRLLLVATLRGPADSPVRLGEVELRRIHVEPLAAADARDLALRHLGDAGPARAALAETLVRESSGHPLFIAELAQHLAQGAEQAASADGEPVGPTQLRLDEALRQRIGRLEEPTRRLLELVAIAGAPLPQSLLAEIAELPYADLAARVATLRAGRLLRTSGVRPSDRAEPYHDRISESLRAGMPAEVARAWHGRLARALEPLPGSSPELLSVHFAGAGEPRRAAEHAVRAAHQATDALAFARSARLFRRALELHASLGDAADAATLYRLEVELGEALVRAGRSREAADVYAHATRLAPPAEALDLRRRAGEAYLVSGEVDLGVETISALLADLGLPRPRSRQRVLMSIGLSRVRILLRGLRYRLREESEIDPELLLKLDIGWAANMGLAFVDVLQATWFQHRYILLALHTGERRRLIRALVAEAGVSAGGGGRAAPRTAKIMAELTRLEASVEQPYERGLLGTIRVLTAHLEGRFADVVAHAEENVRHLEQAGYSASWDIGTMRMMLLHGLFMTGRTRAMVTRSEEILRAARDRGDHYETTLLSTGVQNHVWLVQGDSKTARRIANDTIAGWSKRGTLVHVLLDLIAQTAIDLYEDPESDRAYLRTMRGWSGLGREFLLSFENGRVNCHDLRGRVTVAAARGAPPSEQKALLRAAEKDVRVLERQTQPPAPPIAAAIRAAILHQRGDVQGAVRALATAAEGFDAADMTLHAHAARRRLGTLLGGDEGRALVLAADAGMAAEAVVSPERITAMLVPGFRIG
jgi:serine/threonine protein kinase/tetratricopeptide (TPR) repeat protein